MRIFRGKIDKEWKLSGMYNKHSASSSSQYKHIFYENKTYLLWSYLSPGTYAGIGQFIGNKWEPYGTTRLINNLVIEDLGNLLDVENKAISLLLMGEI